MSAVLVGSAAFGEVDIFGGVDSNIKTGGWGSGMCAAMNERPLIGNSVIKVNTQGLHEGGRIDLVNPVQIASDSLNDEYIQFMVRFTTVSLTSPGAFVSPGFGATSTPGLMDPRMAAYYYQDSDAPVRAKATVFRVILTSVEGQSLEACSAVPMKSEEGWFNISIPLQTLGLKTGDTFTLSRILVFTDIPDNFAIGQIGIVKDDTPITASPGEEQVVAVNDSVFFRADAEGGASQLRYSWNFGDAGPTGEDATGEVVTHRYKYGGDFSVKLTVSDVWGIKAPATVTTAISVND